MELLAAHNGRPGLEFRSAADHRRNPPQRSVIDGYRSLAELPVPRIGAVGHRSSPLVFSLGLGPESTHSEN